MDSAFLACTQALRRHLSAVTNEVAIRDLLYLEAWEINPQPGAGSALRVNQLRRANPELAAEIRAELLSLSAARRAQAMQAPMPVPRPQGEPWPLAGPKAKPSPVSWPRQ